jgi:hypothetical protein
MPDGLRLYLDQMFGLDVAGRCVAKDTMHCVRQRLGCPGLMMR